MNALERQMTSREVFDDLDGLEGRENFPLMQKNLLYILFEALLALFQSLTHTYAHTRLPAHTHTHTNTNTNTHTHTYTHKHAHSHSSTHKHTLSLTPCHLGKQPENLFSSSFSSNRIKSSFHSKFFFPTKKLFQHLELFQCWGCIAQR